MNQKLITIGNDGPIITSTNYWETDYNKQGVLFFSVNAGAFRLLVPDGSVVDTAEMLTAKTVVVSTGPGMNRHCVLEILFDDNSDSPYALLFGTEQTDRIPDSKDNNKQFRFIVYTRDLVPVMDTTCWYRSVSKIPCMRPFKKGN